MGGEWGEGPGGGEQCGHETGKQRTLRLRRGDACKSTLPAPRLAPTCACDLAAQSCTRCTLFTKGNLPEKTKNVCEKFGPNANTRCARS